MPKGKITLPNRKMVPVRSKFKIAGRKSTKSGLNLTTEELIAIANDKTAGRMRSKASKILDRRGVSMESRTPVAVEETV